MKTPHQLAEDNLTLSEQYSQYSGELAKLTKAEGEHYKVERPQHKSDTSVARAFQTTEEGIQMTIVKLKLKSLQVKMSANKLMVEVASNEARGLY
jgi:hypothetical protein